MSGDIVSIGTIGRHADEALVSGSEESRRLARAELRRDQRLRLAMRSQWPELPRASLTFGRYGQVEDSMTGKRYTITQGEIDAQWTPVVAYYIDEQGWPVFLEQR